MWVEVVPKKAQELSALAVRSLTMPGLHFVGGVAGLALQVTSSGAQTWILRLTTGGKRRDMGLGGFPDVDLATARQHARAARALSANGIDPIQHRSEAKRRQTKEQAAQISFAACARRYIDAKSPEWKNAKHTAQWTNTLETYAFPVIGTMAVRDVDLPHVLQVLEPIWHVKTETATRVRSRIEAVLDWAAVHEYRNGPNPARWRGHLDKALAKPAKIASVKHHRALAIDELPAFFADLQLQHGMGARALQFGILTASRPGEVRGCVWSEINLDAAEWRVPATRMKAGREHRVPLTRPALDLLRSLERSATSELVFPSSNLKPLSDMTLSAVMRRMGVDAVPHGFRSTFRDWAAERTPYSGEIVEMALAHAVANAVEAAYRRGDLFDKRGPLMKDWAKFCTSRLVSAV